MAAQHDGDASTSGPPGAELTRRALLPRLGFMPGDPRREQALLPAFEATNAYAIARCRSVDDLLERARAGELSAVLAAGDLLRANGGRALAELAARQVAVTLLVADPAAPRWADLAATVVAQDAPSTAVIAAVEAAVRDARPGSRARADLLRAAPTPPAFPAAPLAMLAGRATLLAVASGAGSPGRTTVAINVGAGLGLVAPTILVDADLAAPSVAWHLDANPGRNLYLLTTAIDGRRAPETPQEWTRALDQELQPLDARCPYGQVLCGLPKAALRGGVTPAFVQQIATALTHRARYLVLDVGALVDGDAGAVQRTVLGAADQILLVGGCTVPGLKRLELALRTCVEELRIDQARVALVLNGYDRRRHHALAEIAWALKTPVAAVIPADPVGIERALDAQRPAIFLRRRRWPWSRQRDAAGVLLELANTLAGTAQERGARAGTRARRANPREPGQAARSPRVESDAP